MGCDISLAIYALPRSRKVCSGSVDAGFIFELPFHHGDLEPDFRSSNEGGGGYTCGTLRYILKCSSLVTDSKPLLQSTLFGLQV